MKSDSDEINVIHYRGFILDLDMTATIHQSNILVKITPIKIPEDLLTLSVVDIELTLSRDNSINIKNRIDSAGSIQDIYDIALSIPVKVVKKKHSINETLVNKEAI